MIRSLSGIFVLALHLASPASAAVSEESLAQAFDAGPTALRQALESATGDDRRLLDLLLVDMVANEDGSDAGRLLLDELAPSSESFPAGLNAYAASLRCRFLIREGRIDRAGAVCPEAAAGVDAVSSSLVRSRIHYAVSFLAVRNGQLQEALEPAQKALLTARQSGSRFARASAWNSIALIQIFSGDHSRAIESYRRMREALVGLEHTSLAHIHEFNLGLAHMEVGNFEDAVESFTAGLEWTQATGQSHRELIAKNYLAAARVAQGEPELALEILSPVVAQGSGEQDPDSLAHSHVVVSRAHSALGRTPEALEVISRGLALTRPAGNEMRTAQLLLARVEALASRGDDRRALDEAAELVESLRASPTDDLDDALELYSELAAAQGRFDLSYEAIQQLEEIEEQNRGSRYEMQVAMLEVDHALVDAQREIEVLQALNDRETALRQRNTTLLAGLLAILGLVVLSTSLNRSRREQYRIADQQRQLTEELEGLVEVRTEALELEMLQRMQGEEERRELERQLAEADKLRALGQLTGGIAHDFNNLLTIVTSASEMLADEPEMPEDERAELIAAIRRAADSGRDVNKGLLAYARQQSLEPEPIDVQQHFEDSRNLFERTLGNAMTLEIDAEPATVLADRSKFTTAIINLLLNARDASDGRGEVALRVRQRRPGTSVAIEIADSGRGMETDQLERAVEPFYSTKTSTLASGLGLSMVYGFVRQSGGDFEIESRPNEGTQVTLILPGGEARRDSSPDGSSLRRLPPGLDVLLVDDNQDVRDIIQRMLENLGGKVRYASDAATALELLASRTPDVLVSDVLMPGDLNGVELADRASDLDPDLPILMISGYANEIECSYSLLPKPFRQADLEQQLLRVLNRQRRRQSA